MLSVQKSISENTRREYVECFSFVDYIGVVWANHNKSQLFEQKPCQRAVNQMTVGMKNFLRQTVSGKF